MRQAEITEEMPFVEELVRTVRARDPYGLLENKPDEVVLKDFLRAQQKRKNFLSELNTSVTPEIEEKVHLFYEAVASRIERLAVSGLMINVTMEIDEEGFGQVVLYHDPVVILSEGLRDVQMRFLFDHLQKLNALGEKMVQEGLKRWQKYAPFIREEMD